MRSQSSSSSLTPASGLTLETRLLASVIVPVLLLAFVLLYFWPDRTEQLFAWTIKPSMTPMWMGGGYLAGTYLFLCVLFAKRWQTVAPAIMGVLAFVLSMALATVLHWDRFNHSHPMFWLWAGVYAVSPILILSVVLRNWRLDSGTPMAIDTVVPTILRWIIGIFFGIYFLLGALMFLWPDVGISLWPWKLTPLTARVVAGWLLLPGVGGLVMVSDRRWSAWRITIQTASIWWVLNLVAFFRAWNDFDSSNPKTWIFVGAMAVSLIGYLGFHLGMDLAALKAQRATAV